MKDLSILSVPFNQDKHLNGMGQAPQALLNLGLCEKLTALGHNLVYTEEVENNLGEGEMLTRLGRLQSIVAADISDSLRKNNFPLLLGGDCCNALGMWGGLTHARPNLKIGIVWFDAHGDWNTEEISVSHYIGGMPFAAVCGYGNKQLRTDVGITQVAQTDHCVLIGARDLDPLESDLIKTTQLTVLPPLNAPHDLTSAKSALATVDGFYLHFDIDSLDLSEAPGVNYPAPNGLASADAIKIVRELRQVKPMLAMSLTAVDPTKDPSGKTVQTGLKILEGILA